jgi:hypothetical protein
MVDMQRWIVIGGVLLCLLVGGVVAGLVYRQNKPDVSYMPIPLKADITADQKKEAVDHALATVMTDKILTGVAHDCGAKDYWKLASDTEAVAELHKRALVEIGTDKNPSGISYTSLRIGFHGKKKEAAMLAKLTNRLGEEFKTVQKPKDDL